MAPMSEHDFKPGDRVHLSETPAISGIVARIHTNPQKAHLDVVVVKIEDSKSKQDLFVTADALQLSPRLR